MYSFPITRNPNPKTHPDPSALRFGRDFTDHMLLMDYAPGKGWHDGRIVPYGNLSLDPATTVLHYAQMMFEGLKAYRAPDGRVLLFRPEMNARRLSRTNERMCIPPMDENLFIEAIKAVVRVDQSWIPDAPGTSLYIRPFILAMDPFIGVHVSSRYLFIIILSPVGAYYGGGDGLKSTSIYVEDEYVRAMPGGTGFAKVGGNYAGSLKASEKATKMGCNQVLWLDAVHRRYVEEIGTSNAFFVIDDEIITAPLAGTILPGVTRDSAIALMRHWGMKVTERPLAIDEILAATMSGALKEVFATGTAAVVSPVGKLVYKETPIQIGDGKPGALAERLYAQLYGMQTGHLPDEMGWTVTV